MPHDIKPSTKHSVLNVQLALHATDGDHIADGLNEFLRPELGAGWIADYALLNSDQPFVITSSHVPEEGELFDRLNRYTVCIQDKDYNEEWFYVETEICLKEMSPEDLAAALLPEITIGEDDRVIIGSVKTMRKINL